MVPKHKTGKVAVRALAQAWLPPNSYGKVGHDVTLFEKNDRVGGLLRYGIPDFKIKGLTPPRRSR
jgi:glutamate synthase (NADPH/NADH) small chain